MVGTRKLSAMAPASSAISNLIMSRPGENRMSDGQLLRDGLRLTRVCGCILSRVYCSPKTWPEFCDTEERLLFELEKIWDYYQTCYPGYIPELICVNTG